MASALLCVSIMVAGQGCHQWQRISQEESVYGRTQVRLKKSLASSVLLSDEALCRGHYSLKLPERQVHSAWERVRCAGAYHENFGSYEREKDTKCLFWP